MFYQSMLPLQLSHKTLNAVQRRDLPADVQVPIPALLHHPPSAVAD